MILYRINARFCVEPIIFRNMIHLRFIAEIHVAPYQFCTDPQKPFFFTGVAIKVTNDHQFNDGLKFGVAHQYLENLL